MNYASPNHTLPIYSEFKRSWSVSSLLISNSSFALFYYNISLVTSKFACEWGKCHQAGTPAVLNPSLPPCWLWYCVQRQCPETFPNWGRLLARFCAPWAANPSSSDLLFFTTPLWLTFDLRSFRNHFQPLPELPAYGLNHTLQLCGCIPPFGASP